MRQRKQGVTLIELLVVVAILVLLAGIIYSVTASAREKGRQVVCVSNLKQIYQALLIYRSDYGGGEMGGRRQFWQLGLPPPFTLGTYGNDGVFTTKYLKNPELWICPSDPCTLMVKLHPECRSDPRRCCKSYTAHSAWEGCLPGMGCFSDIVNECQERFPIYYCSHHGLGQGVSSYAIVLRWNGEVKGQLLRLPLSPCLD